MNGKDETLDKLMWATASVLVDAEHEYIHKPNGSNSDQIANVTIYSLIDTIVWLHYHNVIDGKGFMDYIKNFVESHKGIYDEQIPTLKEN